ncbi:MAG: hypothetical protein ABIG73_01940 [Patescibacteria group bacterium]
MYNAIKKMLEEGGKCLLIEDGKPIGVVLTIAEYEKLLVPKIDSKPVEIIPANPIGEAIDFADLEAIDDVTLDDLGLDEMTSID